jgi:hypothetical protein
MEKIKTIHGHYSSILEEEALRLQKLYKEKLNIDINWMEATSIAAKRSSQNLFDQKKLKQIIMELRGL